MVVMNDKQISGAPNPFPKEEMDSCIAGFEGKAGFYVKDMSTGAKYTYSETERFPTASVFKLPVMAVLFRKAEAGIIDLTERHRLQKDVSTLGTGVLKLTKDYPELTVHDFCRLMIAVSDNMATDMIIRILGTELINSTLDELGFADTRVPMGIGRWQYCIVGMRDAPFSEANDIQVVKRIQAGKIENDGIYYSDSLRNIVASPKDLGILLEMLADGELAGSDSTRDMIDILFSTTNTHLIRAPLKKDIKVAQKYGGSQRISTDAGIVYLPKTRLIITGMTLSNRPEIKGSALIEKITELAVGSIAPDALVDINH